MVKNLKLAKGSAQRNGSEFTPPKPTEMVKVSLDPPIATKVATPYKT